MVKKFVKYIPSNNYGFFHNVDYVYFNSKKWYSVKKDGSKKEINESHPRWCISNGLWVENGKVERSKKHTSGINPDKKYLFVEPDYIWFADGATIIKHKWYNGYTLKTKHELDNGCYVGTGKFLVELP